MAGSSDLYDVTIIGSGPGGYVAAIRAAQLGLRTCLVERHSTLGGTCLNVGCIPSKALLESSELFRAASGSLGEHGLQVQGLTLDLAAMQRRKERIVAELTGGIALLMKKNKITVLHGRGSLLAPDRAVVSGPQGMEEVRTRQVVLATGSRPVELPFLPFDGERVVDSTGALAFDQVPGHLVVVGAGAVGLELGSVWCRLGARVTVVEMMPQIAPFADRQMARTLQRALQAQGLQILLKTRLAEARSEGESLILTLQAEGTEPTLVTCDRVLVAVGRRPFTEGLGLKELGVVLNGAGRIEVNESWRTRVPGIHAIGDVIHGPMLAHKAEEEGLAVAEVLAGQPGHVSYNAIPAIVYTSPELAMVGITEEEARARGQKVRVGRALFRANGRAKSLGEEEGLVKVLADADSDRLLGVHIVGPRASEMIAEATLAMEFAASVEDLARSVHAHPTLSEVLREAALDACGRPLHA